MLGIGLGPLGLWASDKTRLEGPGSQARTGPRGRGRDTLGQGPGPGPLGPGAWGPLGPRCRIRVATVTTYCQASYLLSGKLPTVRQAFSRYETSYLLSGKLPTVRQAFSRSQASYLLSDKPSAVSEMYPEGIDMHPRVSAYFCTQQPHTCTQLYKPFSIHNILNMLI